MKVTITPRTSLVGEITAPPSKARTHRALFAGLLSDGVTEIENPLSCADTEATLTSIISLGATVERVSRAWIIRSNGRPAATANEIDCGESGVTLRFLIPIVSLAGRRMSLSGRSSLMRRPIEPLCEAMSQLGVKVVPARDAVHIEEGVPEGGSARIRGDVSSQFISGLLLAAPLMSRGLSIQLTTPLESLAYVSLTIEIMKRHGIEVTVGDGLSTFEVLPGQKYGAARHMIPGDYSSASFAMAAAAITGSKMLVRGLAENSSEPDFTLIEILSRMGVHTNFLPEGVMVEGSELRATGIDIRNCPDLGPVVAVLGCFAEGDTRITGASRLRYKESDRLNTITSELDSLGAKIKETKDGLLVAGRSPLNGGAVHSHGDHRIAMALGVAAVGAKGPVVIEEAECVSKSYPNFFDDMRSLGVEVVVG